MKQEVKEIKNTVNMLKEFKTIMNMFSEIKGLRNFVLISDPENTTFIIRDDSTQVYKESSFQIPIQNVSSETVLKIANRVNELYENWSVKLEVTL